jgi:hypothetical protein
LDALDEGHQLTMLLERIFPLRSHSLMKAYVSSKSPWHAVLTDFGRRDFGRRPREDDFRKHMFEFRCAAMRFVQGFDTTTSKEWVSTVYKPRSVLDNLHAVMAHAWTVHAAVNCRGITAGLDCPPILMFYADMDTFTHPSWHCSILDALQGDKTLLTAFLRAAHEESARPWNSSFLNQQPQSLISHVDFDWDGGKRRLVVSISFQLAKIPPVE